MAYQLTPWGYEVDGDLPPLIDYGAMDALTGGKWSSDPRLYAAIDAASAVVRAHCGWHVAPSMPCRATVDGDGTRSLWLPTMCLTSVESVELRGPASVGFQWSRIGQVLPDVRAPRGLQSATVAYQAGFQTVPADLEATVAALVTRYLAMGGSYGVASQSAGGVSVTYSGAASLGGAGVALVDADRAALAPYRVVRAHAS